MAMDVLICFMGRKFPRFSSRNRGVGSAESGWGRVQAFSLLEVMVAVTLLSIVMLLLIGTTNAVSKLWRESAMKTGSYNEAREAFDTLTAQLSQLSLQPYWDYVDASGSIRNASNLETFVPVSIKRQSDLHFILGPTTDIVPGTSATTHPGHAVFFQKLGSREVDLPFSNLLETAGFFVESVDAAADPYTPSGVLSAVNPTGQKMRLVEVQALPADTTVYSSANWISDLDIRNPNKRSHKRIAAENVILLILRARLSEAEDSTGAALAPDYLYNSRAWVSETSTRAERSRNTPPPIIDVVMVVLEEDSAERLSRSGQLTPEGMGYGNLFANAADLDIDLQQLQDNLNNNKIGHRLMRASVPIANARWGED